MNLNEIRESLSEIDDKALDLLAKRSQLLAKISLFKGHLKRSFDPAWEAQKRQKVLKVFGEDLMFLMCQWISLSRSKQEKVVFYSHLEDMDMARKYLGVFADIRVFEAEFLMEDSSFLFQKMDSGDYCLSNTEEYYPILAKGDSLNSAEKKKQRADDLRQSL